MVCGVVVCLIVSCEAWIVPVHQKGLVKTRMTTTKQQSIQTRISDPEGGTAACLGLLSFDLDDTLFSIRETVNDANDAMIRHMNQYLLHNHDPCSIDEFIAASREIRKILQKKPITYTELRKFSIRKELEKRKHLLKTDMDKAVHAAFDAWRTERHAAAERYLFDDTLSTLQSLRERYPDTYFAAITNGLGNPLQMNSLAPYFDFSVSGEEQDIFPHRKPYSKIYQVALQRYQALYPHHHQMIHAGSPYLKVWCHVGDCLAKDVGASYDCGAMAVWYAPDAGDVGKSSEPLSIVDEKWSTASKNERMERQKLASIAKAKVAIQISKLSELENALEILLLGSHSKSLLEIAKHD
jgi:FMN phosphatase YigB (HAD superfamily)